MGYSCCLPQGRRIPGTQVPAFHGITVDMSSCSDQVITLAAIAPFADSPTCITGIGHIRFQESDRIHAICTELTRMGIHCRRDTGQHHYLSRHAAPLAP